MKRNSKNIDQQLLVLYLLDEISEAGRFEVEVWLESSEENRREFESFRKTWEKTGELDIFPRQIDVDNAWGSFSERINADQEMPAGGKKQPVNKNARTIKILSYAAAAVFLAWLSLTMVRLIQNDTFKSPNVIASNEDFIKDTLSDGSSIHLNQNSEIRIARNFDKNDRKVELEGEAFFEVSPDSLKPFVIEAELGRVKVLGTSFQVKSFQGEDMEVYVEEGRVELSGESDEGANNSLILGKGQRGLIKYPGGEIILGDNIEPDDLFWANKKLIFEETKLSLVFELLRKHYSAEIEVENDNIKECQISAVFNNEELEQIIEVISASFSLSYEKSDGKYIIKGEGCSNE